MKKEALPTSEKTKTKEEKTKQDSKKKEVKKKDTSSKNKKAVKKGKKGSFWKDAKNEFVHIKWPDKKAMVKYSVATLFFIVFFALFFYVIEIIFAFLKSLV